MSDTMVDVPRWDMTLVRDILLKWSGDYNAAESLAKRKIEDTEEYTEGLYQHGFLMKVVLEDRPDEYSSLSSDGKKFLNALKNDAVINEFHLIEMRISLSEIYETVIRKSKS